MKLKLILTTCILVFLFSCQKEISKPAITEKPLTTDSIYLSQAIGFDTTKPAGLDTVDITIFHYDNLKRNTSIIHTYFENGKRTGMVNAQFIYNGTDTLPSKSKTNTYLLPSNVMDIQGGTNNTVMFFYNNGMLIMDSTIEFDTKRSTVVNKYTYSLNQIVTNTIYYDVASNVQTENFFATHFITRADGNIVEQHDTVPSVNSKFHFVFDRHPNPLYKTQAKIFGDISIPYYSIETYFTNLFEKNNAIETYETVDNYPGGSLHYKNVYQYNAKGYPAFIWVYDQNDATNISKGQFFYTN